MCVFDVSAPQGHEQRLLKDLALSREQLKRDLAAARQELELVAGSADAAKEEAAAQVNLISQQLAVAQQRAAEAEKVRVQHRAAVLCRPVMVWKCALLLPICASDHHKGVHSAGHCANLCVYPIFLYF
jgi:hypothetical protein